MYNNADCESTRRICVANNIKSYCHIAALYKLRTLRVDFIIIVTFRNRKKTRTHAAFSLENCCNRDYSSNYKYLCNHIIIVINDNDIMNSRTSAKVEYLKKKPLNWWNDVWNHFCKHMIRYSYYKTVNVVYRMTVKADRVNPTLKPIEFKIPE